MNQRETESLRMISVREHPECAAEIIAFFQKHWATEASAKVYEDCITSCLTADGPLPQWYVLADGERFVAGAGLIPNDFISRMDLGPWLCALIVEEDMRGRALGAKVIAHVRAEAARLGFDRLYLCTDHIGYYEKYGFVYVAEGWHPWGESSRIYAAQTEAGK
jgi:GNAT superfamily N-acetyltransferase